MKEILWCIFSGSGGVLAKAANVFENASEKGNWENRGGRGGLWIKESAVAKHPYCVQMLPCTPQLTFLFCNYLSYHFYLFIFICLFISAMHPYYVQMMPCIPTHLLFCNYSYWLFIMIIIDYLCIPTLLPFSQLFSLVSPTFIIQDASVHN